MTAGHSKVPRNQVFGVLKAGSTVNDIAHNFGCSRQTIHDLMNLYNSTASVRVRARPGRTCDSVTSLSRYTLTRPRNRFNQQPLMLGLYGVRAQKIINHFIQNNGPDTAGLHTTRKLPHNTMHKITSTSFLDLLYPQS